jgi:hydroxyethylthiazole kinase-like uncharacterized protein yjeF
MLLVTAEEMRALDAATIESGTPGEVLMERAGAGATQALVRFFPHMKERGARAVIVAGKGNNGGDGFVIARLLRRRGVRVALLLLGRSADLRGDALQMWQALRGSPESFHEIRDGGDIGRVAEALDGAECVVDAIFGTGLSKPVKGIHAEVIELVNACGVPVFAVDIPSGLHADTGQALGTVVQAEATATFGFAKVGQVLYPGSSYCGELAVVDIGIAADAVAQRPPRTALLLAADLAPLVPRRLLDAHKGVAGHLLVVAGSLGKTGAALLATRAASRCGAGLVTVAGPASLNSIYAGGVLEAMTAPLADDAGLMHFEASHLRQLADGKSALVIGPGLGTHSDVRRLVDWSLAEAGVPLVLDADALTVLAADKQPLRESESAVVLTPHPGEMARLIGDSVAAVQADRVGCARRFAVDHGCVLVLKGARTVVAAADGFVWVNSTGNPGMASGGMGDVLAGMIGGLLAQGVPPAEAARLAVYVHGMVGDRVAERGELGLIASDIVAALPRGLQEVRDSLSV